MVVVKATPRNSRRCARSRASSGISRDARSSPDDDGGGQGDGCRPGARGQRRVAWDRRLIPRSTARASVWRSSIRALPPHAALTGKVVASVQLRHRRRRRRTHSATARTSPASSPVADGSRVRTSLYKNGIAPGAHLINVRVLNREGVGYTSDVIAGIQWIVANRGKYAIKVVNLSLGHPQVEPVLDRSALPRGRERRRPPAWSSWPRPVTTARTPPATKCSAASRRPATRRARSPSVRS